MNNSIILIGLLAVAALQQAGAQTPQAQTPKTTTTRVMQPLEPDSSTDDPGTTTVHLHHLGVQLFSIIPSEGVDSFRGQPAPGARINAVGGIVGPAYSDDEYRFGVNVSPRLNDGRYTAEVEVTPWKSDDGLIKASTFAVDLSDFKTTTIELAQKNERVYLLSLTPGVDVQEIEPAKPITESKRLFEQLTLENSAVILDGDTFLGNISNTGALTHIIVPGEFILEFTLVPIKDATASGELRNGVLRMNSPDGRIVEIYNVSTVLGSRGPYQVWTRWKPPTETYDQAVQRTLAQLEHARKEGLLLPPEAEIDRILERLRAGRPFMDGHGSGGIVPRDRLD